VNSDAASRVVPPAEGSTWVALTAEPLPVGAALEWAHAPNCGGVVLFSGVARDHSDGREDVSQLEYEAYESQVEPRLLALADDARVRWPDLERLVLMHRTGPLEIGESAVVVVASAPHRAEAFAGARFCIDALKATVPIWKRETWAEGEEWGIDAQHIAEVNDLSSLTVGPDGSVQVPKSD